MDNRKLFDRLLTLWKSEFGANGGQYVPLVPILPRPNCLLFVGLNPSFSAPVIRRLLHDRDIDPEEYFSWMNRAEFDPEIDIELHNRAKAEYAYFGRFRKLSKMLGVEWDHTDLFFWRETSQQSFRGRILEDGKVGQLSPFGRAQIEIACEMIEASVPKCIVVSNALASDIYKERHKIGFSSSRGCYIQVIGGREVPVFLSSMLTGQRALDKYSFERLAWHLGRELRVTVEFGTAV